MKFLFIILSVIPLFASSSVTIFSDKAQIFKKEHLHANVIHNLPQTMTKGSFIIYSPKIPSYVYKKAKSLSIQEVWKHYLNKTVFYKNKKVTLRFINRPYALIEMPNKQLCNVDFKEIRFPPYKRSFQTSHNRIILPKKFSNKELYYSYMVHGIKWKSFYTLKLKNEKEALLAGKFEITNNTDVNYRLDSIRLIAGSQNTTMHAPVYYKSKSIMRDEAQPVAMVDAVNAAPMQNYYSYTYKRKTALLAKSQTYIAFINKSVPIDKKYTIHLSNLRYLNGETKTTPQVKVRFQAPKALPYGKAIFLNAQNVYLGDATVPNTPKGNQVTLDIGKDFFSKAKERIVDIDRYKRGFRATVEYTLTNRSKEPRAYELLIPLHAAKNASITTSKNFSYKDANTVMFEIKVAPNKQERFEVTYEQRK